MANITKRGDSYRITVSNGFDHNNKRIMVTMTYKPKSKSENAIKKEVEAEARRFEDRVKSGEYYSGENITFMDFADTWFEKWAKKKVTVSTQESYLSLIQLWAFPVIGKKKLSRITAFDIQQIVENMEAEGRTAATIRRAIAATNSVMKYAYRMNMIKENVVD